MWLRPVSGILVDSHSQLSAIYIVSSVIEPIYCVVWLRTNVVGLPILRTSSTVPAIASKSKYRLGCIKKYYM